MPIFSQPVVIPWSYSDKGWTIYTMQTPFTTFAVVIILPPATLTNPSLGPDGGDLEV